MSIHNDGEWNSPAMVFAMLFGIAMVCVLGALIRVSEAREAYCEAVGEDHHAMSKSEAVH